jgi:hypothetical protein
VGESQPNHEPGPETVYPERGVEARRNELTLSPRIVPGSGLFDWRREPIPRLLT